MDHGPNVGHSLSGRSLDSRVSGRLAGVSCSFVSGFAIDGQGPGSLGRARHSGQLREVASGSFSGSCLPWDEHGFPEGFPDPGTDLGFAEVAGGVPVLPPPACFGVETSVGSHVVSDVDCTRLSASYEVSSASPQSVLESLGRVGPGSLGKPLKEGFGVVVGQVTSLPGIFSQVHLAGSSRMHWTRAGGLSGRLPCC